MRVRIIQPTGYRDRTGTDHQYGEVADLPDHIAVKIVGYRIAEVVREAPVEVAVKPAPANTAKRTGKADAKQKG